MKLYKISFLFIIASLLFISCNDKDLKGSLVGKWNFKEMTYQPGNMQYDTLSEPDKKKLKEDADRDAKGTVFEFTEDGHYTITPPAMMNEELLKGTYTMKGKNQILLKRGSREAQTGIISFPDKNLLKIEDSQNHITILMERLK